MARSATVYLQCGDFDADGVALYESGVEDVLAFARGLVRVPGYEDSDMEWMLRFERPMLTEAQIAQYVPEQSLDFIDPATIKPKDYRGRAWYDDMSARGLRPYKSELEALDLATRLEIVRGALEEWVDMDALTMVKARAAREREALVDAVQGFAGQLTELLADDEGAE